MSITLRDISTYFDDVWCELQKSPPYDLVCTYSDETYVVYNSKLFEQTLTIYDLFWFLEKNPTALSTNIINKAVDLFTKIKDAYVLHFDLIGVYFSICLCIADKIINDEPYNNLSYASLLQLDISIFNNIELYICNELNWEFNI